MYTSPPSMDPVESFLSSVGLSQYSESFRQNGFDSWASLASITEDDMAALEVKRGDRRRLQREIAAHESTGRSPVHPTALNSNDNSRATTNSERRLNANSFSRPRKYRRHPKPDIHAPKRPLTAYVRFSNDKREEYRENGWSFPQLAKQIGHDWRRLTHERRVEYLADAEEEKRTYHSMLERYRKTDEYQAYQSYLKDFNQRHRPGKPTKAGLPSDTPSDEASVDQDDSSQGADMGDQYLAGDSPVAWSPIRRDYIDFHNPLIPSQRDLTPDSHVATGSTFDDDSGFPDGNMVPLAANGMFAPFDGKDESMLHIFNNEQHFMSPNVADHTYMDGLSGDPLGFLTTPSYPYYVQ